MNKDDIISALNNIVERNILKPDDFWLSNTSALVMYGIKDSIEYVSINSKRNIFEELEKTNKYFQRRKGKTRIMQIHPQVILYEDNRPCRFCYKDGFKIETINSILSKKLFYGDAEDLKEVERIQQYVKEHKEFGS